jgi:hypothetical protein
LVGNSNANGTPMLPAGMTVAPRQVEEIQRHARFLQTLTGTGPHENEAKGRAILMLFAVLASEPVPASIGELRQLAYLESVAKVPAWAVEQAARAWRDGAHWAEGENRNFVPKPAELMRLVNLALAPTLKERTGTERLLAAIEASRDSQTDEERARVGERFAAFKTGMQPARGPTDYEAAMDGLQRHARNNGVDFETAFASIPNAPERSTVRKA